MANSKYYAVKKGRKVGIYQSWDECKAQTEGYSGAIYKGFKTRKEAENYLNEVDGLNKDTKAKDNCLNAYINGYSDKCIPACSFGAIVVSNDKTKISYGKRTDIESTELLDVSGEITGAIKAMRIGSSMPGSYSKLVIHHSYEGIAKWCDGTQTIDSELSRKYVSEYKEISEVIPIEFISMESGIEDRYYDSAYKLAKYALEDDLMSIVNEVEYHDSDSDCIGSFESIKELNISLSDGMKLIQDICNALGIEMRVDRNDEKFVNLLLSKNYLSAKLQLILTSKGITVNPIKNSGNIELLFLVIKEIENQNVEKVEEKKYCYKNVKSEKVEVAIANINLFNDSLNYTYSHIENPDPSIKHRFAIISNDTNEKVSIFIYCNNTIEIRGIKYLLWQEVCYIIEESIGVTLSDIIGRISVGTDLKFNDDNVDKCDEILRKEFDLSLVDSFMEKYDYDVILSVKCLFDYKIKVPDFGTFIDPLTRAFEGYFKSIIKHLRIATLSQLRHINWNFGNIFDNNRDLKVEYHNLLSLDANKRNKQLDILKRMCSYVWDIRNAINHSGPGRMPITYSNYDDAFGKFSETIELIKESYSLLV
jgi:ribonuclease HI